MATYWENSCSFGLRYVSWLPYKYLIVSLVFSHLGFWSGNLFLIAPFPDLCLLVPSNKMADQRCHSAANAKSVTMRKDRQNSDMGNTYKIIMFSIIIIIIITSII